MRRVRRTVSWPAAGSAKKPGAMTRTTHGAARMPRRDRPPRISSIIPVTTRSMRSVSARERVVTCSVKTGMKADDSAPSATSRRRRFGSRKATKKASVAAPAPKARAMTRSRRKPRIRLASVAALTTAAARATARRAVGGGRLRRRCFGVVGADREVRAHRPFARRAAVPIDRRSNLDSLDGAR